MKFRADFHIHSHYSIATSKQLAPEYLDYWARLKGIHVLGTGDFTHPGWLAELNEKLEPACPGLYRLKQAYRMNPDGIPWLSETQALFIPTGEVSTIFKKKGQIRKIHLLLLTPNFDQVKKIQHELSHHNINISSDGRPIMGLDARELFDLLLKACRGDVCVIPAHIWTPWFSILGDKSGFNSIEECFEDLTSHIFAVETGLSSDPPMNWLCRMLDPYSLISNSDAHSPEKIGREANIFNTDLNFTSIIQALNGTFPDHFLGTIEFFPQEGKYHFDGHRKCEILWHPSQTTAHQGICPKCGKGVTIGVLNRVAQLADRQPDQTGNDRRPYYSAIPLKEILAEICHSSANSQKVNSLYIHLLKKLGPELPILLDVPLSDIEKEAGMELAEGIKRMRGREVFIEEGYDGEYGRIKVFKPGEMDSLSQQKMLFIIPGEKSPVKPLKKHAPVDKNTLKSSKKKSLNEEKDEMIPLIEQNSSQLKAIEHKQGPALVLAGPGSGKTGVLTRRIVFLIDRLAVPPEQILAVTFTNKAAAEIHNRLTILLKNKSLVEKIKVCTFHFLGLSILKENHSLANRSQNFSVIDEDESFDILQSLISLKQTEIKKIQAGILQLKQQQKIPEEISDQTLKSQWQRYEDALKRYNLFDLDDLIYKSNLLLTYFLDLAETYNQRFQYILVDEYQDINLGQYHLLKKIKSGHNPNLFVIGDPHQAIYGFRGADVSYINRFTDDYPLTSVYSLVCSYRCSDTILQASAQVMNISRPVESRTGQGIQLKVTGHSSDASEAEFIARTIETMSGGVRFFSMDSQISSGDHQADINSLEDFAILCRLSEQFKALKKALGQHGIPFQTVAEIPFYRLEPVKTLLRLFKYQLVDTTPYLEEIIIKNKVLSDAPSRKKICPQLKKEDLIRQKLQMLIDHFFSSEKTKHEQHFNRILKLSEDFENRDQDFLTFMATGQGQDSLLVKSQSVTLMTIHAAKGLEFKCVFIPGCEQGLIPYSLFHQHQVDVEEEKRLLYVAMTRAKKYLFLTWAQKRMLFGQTKKLPPSLFLEAINNQLYDFSFQKAPAKKKDEQIQPKLFDF